MQVRQTDRPWLTVHSSAHQASDRKLQAPLLATGDLQVSHLAAWLNKVEQLGPVAPVVVGAFTGTIHVESRVLELTTVLEGLHRRLKPDAVRYSREDAEAIRAAAAVAAAEVKPGSEEAVNSFLGQLHEVGFARRLNDLAEIADELVPGVAGRANRWRAIVYAARNDFAHRAKEGWLSDEDVDRYVTVALSVRWVVQSVLLGQAGLAPDVLSKRFTAHPPYQLFLEQAAVWQPKIYPAV